MSSKNRGDWAVKWDVGKGFTPYGYLQNPYYQCVEGFSDIRGALLRSDDAFPGFGTFFPNLKQCDRLVSFGVGVRVHGKVRVSRADWEHAGYDCHRRSNGLFSYRLPVEGPFPDAGTIEACFFQTGQNALGVALDIPESLLCRDDVELFWVVHLEARGLFHVKWEAKNAPSHLSVDFIARNDAAQSTRFSLFFEGLSSSRGWLETPAIEGLFSGAAKVVCRSSQGELFLARKIEALQPRMFGEMVFFDSRPLASSEEVYLEHRFPRQLQLLLERKQAQHDAFWRKMPVLQGDWPEHVARGFAYDFLTTSMCMYPPMGVFRDVWPSWMLFAPRAVLAEGAMDANRLGYAEPQTAKRALLTLFRDTGGANVPCVFFSGKPNMVAQNGAVCGTSPAWCLPFHQVYQLYLRDPDRQWLGQLYPYVQAYLSWWREHRSDGAGYTVYMCTWEAGEDESPRLDPARTGDAVISGFVRPVELQAAMAYGARMLAFFAEELGEQKDVASWEGIAAFHEARLQALWDEEQGRFRDWDIARKAFVAVRGKEEYWNADFTRLSPLSLASVFGDACTPAQKERMKAEIPLYGREPFNVWPSWNYVVAEAATELGLHGFAARFAWETIQRVYRENDRRNLVPSLPLPGNAREYWPHALGQFRGNDAYAWGAQTAQLLLRQLMGIRGSENTGALELVLCPALPAELLDRPGRVFGVSNLAYRGLRLSVRYEVLSGGKLRARVHTGRAFAARLFCAAGKEVAHPECVPEHVFVLENLQPYRLRWETLEQEVDDAGKPAETVC